MEDAILNGGGAIEHIGVCKRRLHAGRGTREVELGRLDVHSLGGGVDIEGVLLGGLGEDCGGASWRRCRVPAYGNHGDNGC